MTSVRPAFSDKSRLVCAIDPGLSRLAVAAAWVSATGVTETSADTIQIDAWQCCMTLNLMRMADECRDTKCPHNHTREIIDGFNHLLTRFDVFYRCDVLIIERQPPQGHVTIQNLFLQRFGATKVQLVDPTQRNTHFGWARGKTTRWERKRMATHLVQTQWCAQLACGFYDKQSIVDPVPTAWEREEMTRLVDAVLMSKEPSTTAAITQELFVFEVHDRADAILLVVFWLQERTRRLLPPLPVVVSKYFSATAIPHKTSLSCRSSIDFLEDTKRDQQQWG
jgi:hypothetical protein